MANEDESAAPGGPGPAKGPFPLLIAVTPSPAERLRLAELLDGVAPLLLVADLDELRRLIAATQQQLPAAPSAPAPADTPAPMPASAPAPAPAPAGMLLIDSNRSAVRYQDREVNLTRLEHDLLACLTSEPIRVWSYAELHQSVWRDGGLQRNADVQSLVKRLRRKLNELGTGVTIDAVRGVGFRLTDHQRPQVGGA